MLQSFLKCPVLYRCMFYYICILLDVFRFLWLASLLNYFLASKHLLCLNWPEKRNLWFTVRTFFSFTNHRFIFHIMQTEPESRTQAIVNIDKQYILNIVWTPSNVILHDIITHFLCILLFSSTVFLVSLESLKPLFSLYTGAHYRAYYCMDIHFWYSGVYHMVQIDFWNAWNILIVCMISILTIQ